MQKIFNKIEEWFYKETIQNRLLYFGFGGVFILIFALNYYFPIYADDMMYRFVKYGEPLNLMENLKEIGEFMDYYYFNWGGRVVAIGSVHLLLLVSFLGQDIINTIIYLCLLYFAYKISIGTGKTSFLVFLFLAISIFYFTPSFLSSAIWITGSGVFLLTSTLTLALIYLYFRYNNGHKYKDSVLRMILVFLFAIVASWSNENTGPTLFLIVIAFMAISYLGGKTLPRWAIAGLIGVIIGCSMMILAPGNAVRSELEGYPGLFSSLDTMLDRLPQIYASYRYFMFRPILIYLACIVLQQYFAKDESKKKKVLLNSLVFFISANISIWITIFAPSFPPRAFMSITVLTVVAIGILYGNIDFRKMLPRVLNIVLLLVLALYAAIDYYTFLRGSQFLHKVMQDREKVIDECRAKGINNVTFEKVYMDYRFEYTDFTNYYKDYYNIDAQFLEKGDPSLDEVNGNK